MDLELLLEAERRGILPADMAQLLAEARRRGLVPAADGTPPARRSVTQLVLENVIGDNDPNTQNFGERVGTWLNKAGESLTFGLVGDEASAAGAALLPGGMSYAERLAYERQQERLLEQNNPGAALSAEVGGAIAGVLTPAGAMGALARGARALPRVGGVLSRALPGGMVGTLGRGAGMASRIGTGAAAGAGMGATYGFTEGEGGLAPRAQDALTGAIWGGALGGAAAPVADLAVRGGRAVGDIIGGGLDNVLRRGSYTRAQRALAETLAKSGRSADEIARAVQEAAKEGQPEFRVMDAMGVAGQRAASGIVRAGGSGAEELAQYLQQRQLDQANRVPAFVEDAFTGGQGPGVMVPGSFEDVLGRRATAEATREGLTGARSRAANVAYDAARQSAGPVDVRGALGVIDDRIGGMQGSGVSGDGIDGMLSRFRARLAGTGTDNVGRELSDFQRVLGVKQDVQDAIGVAVRAGRNNEARELGKLQTALDRALEEASPDYRAANDTFARQSRVIEAIDTGRDMSRPSMRYEDNRRAFSAMSPSERVAARVGYGDALLAQINAIRTPTTNRVGILNSTKAEADAATIANNPGLLGRRVARENTMWSTQNRALGGSRTADNLADIKDLGPAANVARAVRDLAQFNLTGVASSVQAALQPILAGQSEQTRTLIARALMSSNAEVREPLMAAALRSIKDDRQRQVVEALMRRIGAAGAQ